MRVLLDVEAIAPPLTGIGRYALALARGLQQSRRIERVDFFTVGREVKNLDDLLREGQAMAKLKRHVPATRVVRKIYHLIRKLAFRSRIDTRRYDVFHSPNYRLMPFEGKTVATFHDVSLERFPEFHPPERAVLWHKEIRPVLDRVSHIIADSEFTRREIIELLGVSPDRVTAVYLGVDDSFRPHDKTECQEVLSKFGLAYDGFCLAVATLEPRKNFERLLKAFEELPPTLRQGYPLAIAGARGWLNADIHAAIDRLAAQGAVIRLGYVAEADLPKLYAAAAVFAYPSLYEGFGLPVLEAMASGTAVLSSNVSSIPEVAGNACVLVDPYAIEAISAGWQQLLTQPDMRAERVRAGLLRAREFTWEKCVDQTIDVYEKLMG